MWIVCAGGKRSGSTLQYNIISKIIEESQKGKRLTHFKPEEFIKVKEQNSDYKGFKVFKTHSLSDEIKYEIKNDNAIVFHCYRDIRDVVVSYINKGWINGNQTSIIDTVNNYLNEHDIWQNCGKEIYSRKYEDFSFNLVDEIRYISEVLNIELKEELINEISNELNIESLKKSQDKISEDKKRQSSNQTFHQDTLLHTNHINDGSSNQFLKSLSKSNISLIESLAYGYLLKYDYKLYWPEFDDFISYSQHADDYIAWQLLGRERDGLVVEVGAFDGVHLSNSFAFEQIRWNSICIEPSPAIFKFLEQNRPAAININNAIVGDENISEIDFYAEEIGVLSGCNYDEEDVKKRYENRGLEYTEPKKIKITATTLSSLFGKLKVDTIDVLSIDVEGFELEVLKGLDLKSFNVKLFIIEANDEEYKTQILNFFKENPAYIYVGNNYQNLFFVKKKYLLKRIIRKLDFKNYIKAKQYHPKGSVYVIDSLPPRFVESNEVLKFKRYLGIF
ncbi:MAG: FkbM family methyltransferase [Aequorivita antarctica]